MLRPHILVGWISAVAAITILHRGRRLLSVLVILCLPLVFISLQKLVPVDSTTQAETFAQEHFKSLRGIQQQGSQDRL